MRKAVFLDRDGVLTRCFVRDGTPHPPDTVEELEILPGVIEGCAKLKDAGYLLICVTNQPDVARGAQKREVVEAMNDHLRETLALDAVYVCYHDNADNCQCRKPRPGMLITAAEKFGIDLAGSYMIGDRWRDVEAGARAGCITVFVDCGYTETYKAMPPDLRVSSTAEAVEAVLSRVR